MRSTGKFPEKAVPQASVATYASAWSAQKKLECKASTCEHYEKGINKFLAFLGERSNADLSEIEKRSIVAFRDSLIPKVSIKTANCFAATIGECLGPVRARNAG
jgi:hypothetical protein